MKIHLIGIAGTGMGSVAGLLKEAGHEVRGSDEKVYPPMSDQLKALGVPFFEGFAAENLAWGPERVVVGNVCRKDHVEVIEAQARGITLTSFPAILEELLLPGKHSVVVSGTHGKTTTTSLLAHALTDAGQDPSALIGGVPLGWGRGYRLGKGEHFVLEGDEYDTAFFDKGSKFLHYQPRTVILTGVELDHVDIFDSLDAVKAAFRRFIALIPAAGKLLVAASSPHGLELARQASCPVETYAAGERGTDSGVAVDWHASLLPATDRGARTRFVVTRRGEAFGVFHIGLPGEHNVENALAVIACGASLGLGPVELGRALARFRGVKRRQEVRGVAAGVTVIDDYAHHPTAVKETLAALRARKGGRGKLVALYEPRSATSRRAIFQEGFVEAFAGADEVVVTRLYDPDRIPPAERFDPERLAADLHGRGVPSRYLAEVDEVVAHVAGRVQPGDTVVAFSSGAFGGVHDKLLARLGDPVMPAQPQDMRRVRAILDRTSLPHKDLSDDRFGDVLVVRGDAGDVVATVTVEPHDDSAILRCLAVSPESRGRGYGWMLADAAVARARELGAQRLYLLTESASDFFAEKLGFRQVERVTVEPEVSQSATFRDAGSKSAICMKLDL
jgi:UDP-N-acetylmuramate: L-alanyl-gamma-D-glutamyl-meso-diaminopimelate ligase